MNRKKLVRGTMLTALCMMAMLYFNSTVSRAYWVVVLSDNTRVRNEASLESEVMTAVNAGDRLDVYSEEQGADGNTWYKVSINNVSGYVRADTVQKDDGTDAAAALTATESVAAETTEVPASSSSVVETIPSQSATVKTDNVNVRATASANGEKVTSLKSGAAVTLTGTAQDSSGKKWYQVNFINNGSNVTGFIREDLLELGEVVEQPPVTETPEGEAGAEGGDEDLADIYGDMPAENEASGNNDYELFFEPDAEGVNCWYIHDNLAGKRYKLEQLMQLEEMSASNMEIKDKEIGRIKIAVIVLAVLLVLALAMAGFFGFKYHDLKDDDDDEDDDDDDDDFREAPPVRRKARVEQEPVRSSRERTARTPQTGAQRRPAPAGARRPEAEGRAPQRQSQVRRPEAEGVRRPAPAGTRPQSAGQTRRPAPQAESTPVRKSTRTDVEWKSKNFLADDDDDYSFINMDDDV